jgi:hypothetical protein
MSTYIYPEARELQALGPVLQAPETINDPLLTRILPITKTNAPLLQWSVEDDDYGLQQLRGIDGAPTGITPLGKTNYMSEPGYFGEYQTIGERELTLRGGSMIGETTMDVTDMVMERQKRLVRREVTVIRYIGWTLLTTGTFTITGPGGTLTYTDTFALQTYNATTWATVNTATPLADFRAVQTMGAEFGTSFGGQAIAVMNRTTANNLLANTNASDLAGRRTNGGGTITSVPGVNNVLTTEDLPQIVVVDMGYKDANGTFQRFIGNGIVVVVGLRDQGDRIGEYRMTRNLNNPGGAPGSYDYIKDYAQGINAPKETPPKIEVHRGHTGGPIVQRPKSILVMDVS